MRARKAKGITEAGIMTARKAKAITQGYAKD